MENDKEKRHDHSSTLHRREKPSPINNTDNDERFYRAMAIPVQLQRLENFRQLRQSFREVIYSQL